MLYPYRIQLKCDDLLKLPDFNKLKVAICVIAKQENLYIREWVEYYKKLGVDNIYLFDNNDIENGEHFEEVIADYILSGFVIMYNIRGQKTTEYPSIQTKSYELFYRNTSALYDWILFIDCDEFLYLENGLNIKQFLSKPVFNDFQIINVNWRLYDDNDLLYYDDRPCVERFTRPSKQAQFINHTVKSIVRGGYSPKDFSWINNLKMGPSFVVNPHIPYYNPDIINVCDFDGNKIERLYNPATVEPHYTNGYLKHFNFKTIDEYCRIKMKRLVPDRPDATSHVNIQQFFNYNNDTEEKWKIALKILNGKI